MDNKLSELSKPTALRNKHTGRTFNATENTEPQIYESLYSQEYVSALKHESAVNWEAAASLNVENQELKKRIAELEAKTAMTMGVGSGNGNLFVHGDYDSIKAAQAIVLENESLRAKLATPVRLPRPGFVTCSGERHYTYGADEVKGAIHAAGFTVEGDE